MTTFFNDIELDLVPADGRDYLSGAMAAKDWNAGVEFSVQSGRKLSGETLDIRVKRITREQALELGVVVVKVRFNAANGYRSFARLSKPTNDWV